MQSIEGKIAIVTGASSGIGRGIARELARAGAVTILAARSADKLRSLADEIAADGGTAHVVPTDVTREEDLLKLFSETERLAGPVDILVNAAGVMYFTMMKNLHEDEWERTIDTNCKGVVNGVGAVLQQMLARKRGRSRRRLPSEITARSTRD